MGQEKNSSTYSLSSTENQKEITLSHTQKSILKLISQNANIAQISREMNIERSSVRWHLRKLSILNLIERPGTLAVWKITNMGKQVLTGGGEKRLHGSERVAQKGCKLGERLPGNDSLTKTEKEVLHLLTNEFLTPYKVAIARNTSTQAIYKTVKSLRKKGALGGGESMVANKGGTLQPLSPSQPMIRLHAEQWKIKPISMSENYSKLAGTSITIDGNTVRFWKESIEIYSNTDFWGVDVPQSMSKSVKYWNRFFAKIENNAKVILLKDGYQNIKLVKCEFAETHNEIAKDLNLKADKLRIYTKEGRLWAMVDNSFNMHEFETVNTPTAGQDMAQVQGYFNDIRDNGETIMHPSKTSHVLGNISHHFSKLQNQVYEIGASQQNTITTLNAFMQAMTPKQAEVKKDDGDSFKFESSVYM